MSKENDERPRRIEVFTGVGRRRSWSRDEKAQIVAESFADGESVSSVARRHGLTSQQLFGWRRAVRVPAEAGRSGAMPLFVPAVMERSDAVPTPAYDENPRIGFDVDGVSVWVCNGADAGIVTMIIRALKAAK